MTSLSANETTKFPGLRSRLWVAIFIAVVGCDRPAEPTTPPAAEVLQTFGKTMGTRYEVKIASPPSNLSDDWKLLVDRELRQVNDQMSTYLKTSELSRFNDSKQLDWFSVSPETASVVAAALDISEQTEGAYDATIGPLVDLWSFGPGKTMPNLPDDSKIEIAKAQVGYAALHARLDPPSLKKDVPELRVDLSSIAKGHGVDRVVALLNSRGCNNVFVNIGGEIRATGDKGDAGPWKAGVERPDEAVTTLLFPVPIVDEAIATSGDYRNFFEVDGQRYSHTIDPRTGRPVTHELASVSVVAKTCMIADAWATAISVLGPTEGSRLAAKLELDVFAMERKPGRFVTHATGRFVQWSSAMAAVEN